MFYLIGLLILLAAVYGPQWWVQMVMQRHSHDRADFPGTGGELARHLLDEAGLEAVQVEAVPAGDHYDPKDKVVRLSQANYDGRSVTAVAVAAHEVSHALQDADGYKPLHLRTRLAYAGFMIERVGSIVLVATPLVAIATRAPHVVLLELGAGLAIMATTVVIHALTLPVEFNASFSRALPILRQGKYLDQSDMPAAQQVLKAAALTYVAAALVSLLNVARWLRILRF